MEDPNFSAGGVQGPKEEINFEESLPGPVIPTRDMGTSLALIGSHRQFRDSFAPVAGLY